MLLKIILLLIIFPIYKLFLFYNSMEKQKQNLITKSSHKRIKKISTQFHQIPQDLPSQKLNCDEVVNKYLQFSLGFEVEEEVQYTKKWLKNSKDKGKIILKKTEYDLKKSFMENPQQKYKNFSTQPLGGKKSIKSTLKSLTPDKIFNRTQMEKFITQRQTEKAKDSAKLQEVKQSANYMKLLSILEKIKNKRSKEQKKYQENTGNQTLQTSIKHHQIANTNTNLEQPAKKSKHQSIKKLNRRYIEASAFTTVDNSLKEIKHPINENNSHENFQPFLQPKVNSILYEPKRKKDIRKHFNFFNENVRYY